MDPRKIVSGRPVCVEPCDPRLAVTFDGGCHVKIPDAAPEDYKLHISRVGDPEWWVRYKGFTQDADHNIIFLLDDEYFSMPPGRYYGQVEAGACCYLIQLDLPKCAEIQIVDAVGDPCDTTEPECVDPNAEQEECPSVD